MESLGALVKLILIMVIVIPLSVLIAVIVRAIPEIIRETMKDFPDLIMGILTLAVPAALVGYLVFKLLAR